MIFNLSSYIGNYEGHTKLARLAFIAESFPALRVEAGGLVLEELKKGMNTAMYSKLLPKFGELIGSIEFAVDELWVNTNEQKIHRKVEILEGELAAAKKSMTKEPIRQCYNEIGHFFRQVGNLNESLKSFLKSRDFCTSVNHNNEMCLNIVSVSLDLGQYFNVSNFLSKVGDCGADAVLAGKFKAASGLVFLHDGSFRTAAFNFLDVSVPLGTQFVSVITDEDVGLYGTLCALATFSRQELRRNFVDKKTFLNSFTALIPELRTLTLGFINGKYDTCLKTLEQLKPRLVVDCHLFRHVSTLTKLIVDRLVLQYFAPYHTVNMDRMAAALGLDYAGLEQQVSSLIAEGRMSARIDSLSQTLHRTSEDSHSAMVEKVVGLSRVHAAALKRDMLRLSLMQYDFCVEATPSEGKGGAGGGGVNITGVTRSRGGTPRDQQQYPDVVPQGGGEWSSVASNVFNFFGGGGAGGAMSAGPSQVEHQQFNEMEMGYEDEEEVDGDDHEDYDST